MENRKSNDAEMTPQQLDRLFELFLACREMDGEDRSVWLREACQGDLSLRRGVERLIREDLSAEGFLSRPMDLVTRVFAFKIAEGQRFGRYSFTCKLTRGKTRVHELEGWCHTLKSWIVRRKMVRIRTIRQENSFTGL